MPEPTPNVNGVLPNQTEAENFSPIKQSNPYEDKAAELLRANPNLSTDPQAVHSLIYMQGLSGSEAGAFSRFASMLSGVEEGLSSNARSATSVAPVDSLGPLGPVAQPGPSWWGRVWHEATTAADTLSPGGFSEAVNAEAQSSNPWIRDFANTAGAFDNAVYQMGMGLLNIGVRGAGTAVEGLSGGYAGFEGFGPNAAYANQQDFVNTINNVTNDVLPSSSNNYDLNIIQHFLANFDTTASRHGLVYATSNLLPTIIGAFYGDEAGIVPSLTKADDVITTTQKLIEDGSATPRDLARLALAKVIKAREDAVLRATEAAKTAFKERAAGGSTAARIAAAITESPARALIGVPLRAAKTALQLGHSTLPLTSTILAGIQAQSSPEAQRIWKLTEGGNPVDAFGRPMVHTSAAQGLLELFGMKQDNPLFGPLSGTIGAAALMSGDPFSALGKFREIRNSELGAKGLFSSWQGLGVLSGADVYRVAGTTARSARIINYIAKSEAPAIRNVIRGFVDSRQLDQVVNALAKAKTPEAVVEIFAQLADAGYMTRSILPTMKIWRVIGRGLQKMTTFTQFKEEMAKAGVDVAANSIDEAIAPVEKKTLAWARRWAGRQFVAAPWYQEDAIQKGIIPDVKAMTFRAGSKNAIPALQNMFIASGIVDRLETDTMGRLLETTQDPQDFMNALYNQSNQMIMSAVSAATPKTIYDSVYVEAKQTLDEQIRKLYDAGGGGEPGVYSNGLRGEEYSHFVDPSNSDNSGFFGHGDTHISQANFLDPREILGMSKKMAAVLKGLDPKILGSAEVLRALDRKSFNALAEYKNANLDGIIGALEDAGNERKTSFIGNTYADALRNGYDSARGDINQLIVETSAERALNPVEKFVSVSQKIIAKIKELEDLSFKADIASGIDNPEKSAIKGQLRAFMDAESQLFNQLREPSVTMADFRKWVDNLDLNLDEKKKLSNEVREAIAKELRDSQIKTGSFLNRGNLTVDVFNKLVSGYLVPLMLSTGGYIWRISGAEAIPNILRFGDTKFLESRLAASIAKRSFGTKPLAQAVVDLGEEGRNPEWEAAFTHPDGQITFYPAGEQAVAAGEKTVQRATLPITEANVMKRHIFETVNLLFAKGKFTKVANDLLGGALTGVQRGVLRAMTGDQFYRLMDDAVNLYSITGGHLPDVGHESAQLYNGDSIKKAMANATYGVSEEGDAILRSRGIATDKFVKADETKNIVTAVGENLRRVHTDQKLYSILQDMKDILEGRETKMVDTDREIPFANYYHGTPKPFVGGGPSDITSGRAMGNLFGPGFYTTDSAEIAKSYTIKDSSELVDTKNLNKTVYGFSWAGKQAPSIMDLEKTVEPELLDAITNNWFELKGSPSDWRADSRYAETVKFWDSQPKEAREELDRIRKTIKGITEGGKVTGARLYKEFKSLLLSTNLNPEEVNQELLNITQHLQSQGFDGFRYQGGIYGGKGGTLHNATIFFDPSKLITESHTSLSELVRDFSGKGKIIGSPEDYQKLHDKLTDLNYERNKLLPASELSQFPAANRLLYNPELSTGIPLKDFSKAQAYNVLSVFTGLNSKTRDWEFIPELMDQALSGKIDGPAELGTLYKELNAKPERLITRERVRYSWQTDGVRGFNKLMAMPGSVTNAILDKTFGKLVSWISREPTYLLEYHMAMEKLRPIIDSGIYSQDQAEIEAMNEALRNMTKYIHNPMDRAAFERNARIYSPFWFAKNQAVRRAWRMFEENPQAFMKYLKINLAVNKYYATHNNNGQVYFSIPGSEWLDGFILNLFGGNSSKANPGFGLSMDMSTLTSVLPFTGNSFKDVAENLLSPQFGQLVSIPMKALNSVGGIGSEFYNKFANFLLGNITSKTGFMSDIVPSSVYRDFGNLARFEWNKLSGDNQDTGTIVGVQIKAMHSIMDNLRTSIVERLMKENEGKLKGDALAVWANANADGYISEYYDKDTKSGVQHRQELMDQSQTAATLLYGLKTILSFSMPFPVSITALFPKTQELNAIMAQKMPDGSPIPLSAAYEEFAIKYPGKMIDLVSTSQAPYGAFPENQAYLNWAKKAPSLLDSNGIPYLAAALIPQGGTYQPAAFQSQLSLKLRSEDTPQQFLDATLTQMGDDFYYNYLVPTYYSNPEYGGHWTGDINTSTISYDGYKALQTEAQGFGNQYNPTWLSNGSPFGNTSTPRKLSVLDDLKQLVSSPEMQEQIVKNQLLTSGDVDALVAAYKYYESILPQALSMTASERYNSYFANVFRQNAANPVNAGTANIFTILSEFPTAKSLNQS